MQPQRQPQTSPAVQTGAVQTGAVHTGAVHTGAVHTSAVPLPGFTDPVADAQQAFRLALQAMAAPGRVHTLEPTCAVPAGFAPALTALLLTLADTDTPLWLPPDSSAQALAFVRFHCASPLVDLPLAARFVAVPAGARAPALTDLDAGQPDYPDRSATLILEVETLEQGQAVTLRGPGIRDTQTLRAAVPEGFWREWRHNHARFPLGVDLFLTCGAQFCALPRTAIVEE
ncbi:phosphonate C-P lyase system protein PhnH [Bordetella genomosp. 5]|uniref:phosphonate C-P lyase system protein PhnH n=1 Tax=Bordetella genomosp. 5 TaxID=1395608 RepID=UPI000B9E609A|nr:phosphonate C-P lyase system protein PhnH [Bordetella genomosp. 5]OZI40072.1 phosphonate C-P lyase system protein PhnH [Bordetella genomosp. 5]